MDHEQATATQATERYILDELTPEQRDQFEEHFFDCPECAEAVRAGTMLALNTRELAKETANRPAAPSTVTEMKVRQGRPRTFRDWRGGLSAVAAAVLLSIVGFQNIVVIPRLARQAGEWSRPRALATAFLRPESRGSNLPVVHGSGDAMVLQLDLSGEETPRQSYLTTIKRVSGPVLETFMSPAKNGSVEIAWPAAKLQPGEYEILVREDSSGKTDPVRFAFAFEK